LAKEEGALPYDLGENDVVAQTGFRRSRFAGFLLALCLLVLPCLAASGFAGDVQPEVATLLREGKASLSQGDFEGAHELFYRAFELDPGNPEANFLLGRAATEKGDYESALLAFERVLLAEPEASARVRLEMARCLFHLGSYEESRELFRQVLVADPPAAVRRNIDPYLTAIERATRRHTFGGVFSLGLSRDDNVRAVPADERIRTALGDVILTGAQASPQNDLLATAALSLNHRYRSEDGLRAWRTSFVNYDALYREEDDLDLNFFALTTGPALRIGRAQWELYGLANYLELDYRRYLGSYGLGTTLAFSAGARTTLNLIAQIEEKTFFSQPDRDATNIRCALGPTVRLGANLFDVRIGAETENADADVNSYDRLELSILYERTLPRDFSLFAGYRYQRSDYEQREPLFTDTRLDKVHYASLGLARLLWRSRDQGRSLSAQLSHAYTEAHSSVSLYRYNKNTTAFLLSYGF
jgi:tetratricopeptide (TPR) repeat protein